MSERPPALPPLDHEGRFATLLGRLEELQVDALVLTDLTNIRYLTGFAGSSAQLLVTGSGARLTTDGRYRTHAAQRLSDAGLADAVDVRIGTLGEQATAIVEGLTDLGGASRVGLEADTVSWAAATAWQDRLVDIEVSPLSDALGPQRMVKEVGEIARIEAAAAIADAAIGALAPLLASEITERSFALSLDQYMLGHGADALSFNTICASGPNAALPHATPSDRVIAPGDLVVLDFGAEVDGYHSDMTRTFVIGDPDPVTAELLDAVTTAHHRGVDAIAPGVRCDAIDAACRGYLHERGLGDEFVHGTGHGVGLVIHEAPWVNAHSDTVLAEGHVVTVEPGVYRPGLGGVRVEDTVLVTSTGSRRLTGAPKDPVIPTGPTNGRTHGDLHG